MSDIFSALRAEFPRDAVSWRAQSMKADGTSAMALAYIDARDVMNRLDEVCGPSGWQDRYEFHGARTVCYLSIRDQMGDWITKADGAGDTDVEAEKGGISDAFKRAAVKWGIGRYLYDLDAPWVPCESYERGGKKYWKRWTADPWSKIRSTPSAPMPGRNAPVSSGTKPAHSETGATLSEPANGFLLTMKMSRCKADLREWYEANKFDMRAALSEVEVAHVIQERNKLGFTLPEFLEAAE